jgi:acyl-CoA:acyl-CoA alkyltransferase
MGQVAVLAGLAHELPPEVVTSAAIEDRLAPLYVRLGLVPGRLELMTGIRERRFWPEPVRPSKIAALAGEKALLASGLDRGRIGALVHASVCRDFLEPATASVVHHALGLPKSALAFDLSNACLGVLNGVALLADLVRAGRIEAGLVVSGEDGRPLVDRTIAQLLADDRATRQSIKGAFASLTIGSAACAIVVSRAELAPNGHVITGSVHRTASEHHVLCQGGEDGVMEMHTDAEALLAAGLALAKETWGGFLEALAWSPRSITKTITHQVGRAHTRALYEALGLDERSGHVTYDRLGNVGSAALPITLSLASETGFVSRGDRVALLGIGSGLSSMMMGIEW